MRTPPEQQTGQSGRHLLDQLSEQLSKQVKDRKQNKQGENPGSGGFVANFSHSFSHYEEDEVVKQRHQFSSRDLQLLLLTLLTNKTAQGYELMKTLEAHSNGLYSPNPGMIYPALTHLSELGLINASLHENRQCYTLSKNGATYLASQHDRANLVWKKLTNCRTHLPTYPDKFELSGNETATTELVKEKRTLKNALMQCRHTLGDEQRRVKAALLQATKAILRR